MKKIKQPTVRTESQVPYRFNGFLVRTNEGISLGPFINEFIAAPLRIHRELMRGVVFVMDAGYVGGSNVRDA